MKKIFLMIIFIFLTNSNHFCDLKITLNVQAKGKRKIPVIIENFSSLNPALNNFAKKIQSIIKRDLIFSENIKFSNENSEFLIKGEISKKQNQILLKLTVRDLFLKQDSLIKYYSGSINVLTRIAHRASNDILQIITGKKSIFEDKILYVDDITGKKQIYLMDYDGLNVKRLTFSKSIATSPVIYKDYLLYTSFLTGRARVVMKVLNTGVKKIIIKLGSFSASPDISQDGKKIIAMFGENGNSDIGLFNLNGKLLKVISKTEFDEVSPKFSHNGNMIAFVSDRTGSPQVYVYNIKTGKTTRVSFGYNYCCYPSWGANDNYVYYSALIGNSYKIFRNSLNLFHIEEITEGEYPDVSKNNKFLIFTRNVNGFYQIFIKNLETGNEYQITNTKSNKYFPRWYYGKY